MNAVAVKLLPQTFRVAVIAADPLRHAQLTSLIRDLGHAVGTLDDADVVLSDSSAPKTSKPTVVLGAGSDDARAKLPRDARPEQIDAALRAVAAGLSVRVAEDEGGGFAALPEHDERMLLTPRETEVLNAVASGLTNKEIARVLGISQHTVKFHLESLMRKLSVSSRAEAVSKSLRLRLLEPYRL